LSISPIFGLRYIIVIHLLFISLSLQKLFLEYNLNEQILRWIIVRVRYRPETQGMLRPFDGHSLCMSF